MAFAMVLTMSAGAFAYHNEPQVTVTTEDWGDGITAVVTTTVYENTYARSYTTKPANRTWNIYDNGTAIGSMTLNVNFSYNGTTAKVASYTSSHTTKSGWSYKNEYISASGGTCTISADFASSSKTIYARKSISCSATGVIS